MQTLDNVLTLTEQNVYNSTCCEFVDKQIKVISVLLKL